MLTKKEAFSIVRTKFTEEEEQTNFGSYRRRTQRVKNPNEEVKLRKSTEVTKKRNQKAKNLGIRMRFRNPARSSIQKEERESEREKEWEILQSLRFSLTFKDDARKKLTNPFFSSS